jgi:hypothetical protein
MQHFNVTQSWPSRGRAAWPVVLLHFRDTGKCACISGIPAIHGLAGKCSCISGISAIHGPPENAPAFAAFRPSMARRKMLLQFRHSGHPWP